MITGDLCQFIDAFADFRPQAINDSRIFSLPVFGAVAVAHASVDGAWRTGARNLWH